MDSSPRFDSNPFVRMLRDPIWQGIGALVTILLPLATGVTWAAWELVSGNVRVLLWLRLNAWATWILLAVLLLVVAGALWVVVAWRKVPEISFLDNRQRMVRMPRFSGRPRVGAMVAAVLSLLLALVVTVGYSRWVENAQQQTVVLVADFLDAEGKDSRKITRELVTQIGASVAAFEEIEVRALGWAIADDRGEGRQDAQRIGEAGAADIVIWGDYLDAPEFEFHVRFELLNTIVPELEFESRRTLGNEQVVAVAVARQQLAMPDSYDFKVALGEHLGALVAFAGGVSLLGGGEITEALRLLDAASEVYGSPLAAQIEPAIRFARGTAYGVADNTTIAEAELSAVITLDPEDARAYYNRGIVRSDIGDLQGAVSDYNQAIALDPESALAYYSRGNARSNMGDLQGAVSDYDRAIALDPEDAMAYINRGNARRDVGDLQGAVSDYNQAIALDPELAGAYNNRGLMRSNMGDLQAAISDYDRAIALDPESATAYINRGAVRSDMGDLQAAISDYDRAIALDPEDARAYYNRGIVRRAMGDLQGAISDYDRAIALDPESALAYNNRGNARRAMGDLQGAVSDYNQAIALDPELAGAYINRGNARKGMGDLQTAISDYDRAIALDPESTMAYNNRGNVRRDMGDLQAAISDFDQAIALDPEFAAAYGGRGIVYGMSGEPTKALEDLRLYLALEPDASNRAQVEDMIAALEAAQ